MKRILFLLLLTSLLLAACQSEPAVLPGDILFADDFSASQAQWTHLANDSGVVGFDANGLRFYIRDAGLNYWSTPGLNFSDVRLEVDALLYAGPVENRIGLICRYQDDLNYYFFVISTDGYYAIGKVRDGEQVLLGQNSMRYNSAIMIGVAINRLRAECQGNTLRFYINDAPVALVDDADFSEGDVGLLAGTFDVGGLDVLFDNFEVRQP